jgi:hypothetical protein
MRNHHGKNLGARAIVHLGYRSMALVAHAPISTTYLN